MFQLQCDYEPQGRGEVQGHLYQETKHILVAKPFQLLKLIPDVGLECQPLRVNGFLQNYDF